MAVTVYLVAIVLANLTVVWFGPGWSIVNAFLFIGLDLTLRDRLHNAWRDNHLLRNMAALIAAGSVISYLLNQDAGRIGLASFVAFAVAASLDAVVYHRTGSITRSNIVGAGADSLLFPAIAFGFPLLWGIMLGQFVAKVVGGEVWRVVIRSQIADPTP
jgi:uncharacterized PurR-regulated membrane protein YhhQ (DUF165 family)